MLAESDIKDTAAKLNFKKIPAMRLAAAAESMQVVAYVPAIRLGGLTPPPLPTSARAGCRRPEGTLSPQKGNAA